MQQLVNADPPAMWRAAGGGASARPHMARAALPPAPPPRTARVAYFIASHVNPDQVVRLVRACRSGSPGSRVLLHHDANVSKLDPKALGPADDIDVLPARPDVGWGAFSMCAMVLGHMRWLMEHRDVDWVYYLSGQDYPIKPLTEIERFLTGTRHDGFIAATPVEQHPWHVGAMRYLYGHAVVPKFLGWRGLKALIDRHAGRRVAAGAMPRVYCAPGDDFFVGLRNPPGSPFRAGFRCYKGSNWWTLNRRAIEYMLRFLRDNPAFLRHYRRVPFAAGESMYTTILRNNPRLSLVVDDNKRFIRWTRPETGHPDTLGSADVPAMIASGKHFARKIDSRKDPRILDLLDDYIGAHA